MHFLLVVEVGERVRLSFLRFEYLIEQRAGEENGVVAQHVMCLR